MTQEEKDQYLADTKAPFVESAAVVLIKKVDTYAQAGVILYTEIDVMALIEDSISSLVDSLPDECVARLCGHVHPRLSGNFGLALYPPPTAGDIAEDFANYAPGSKGVAVYDCTTGIVECFAGTLATENPDPVQMGIPLWL